MNTSFQRTESSDEWHTPKYIMAGLGTFDLDPCAPSREFYTAKECYTKEDDGLVKPWHGRVWLNPPYSRKLIAPFIKKMAEYGNGVALIFNRMDIALWHDVIFPTANAMLILKGRLKFYRPDGTCVDSAGCGSVLVAWGEDNAMALQNCGLEGKFIKLNQ